MIYVQCISTYPQIPPSSPPAWWTEFARSYPCVLPSRSTSRLPHRSSIEMAQHKSRSKGQSVGVTLKSHIYDYVFICIVYCIHNIITYVKNCLYTVSIYVNTPRQKQLARQMIEIPAKATGCVWAPCPSALQKWA